MAKKKTDEEAAQPESDGSIAVNDAWTGMLAVSLLALVVGAGFLAYDYSQYSDDKIPTVTKFTATPPGAPPKAAAPPPKVEPKDGEKKEPEKKELEKKELEKKDA